MKIKYRLYVTVGLIALISLGGCGREDAPVVLESLEEYCKNSQDPGPSPDQLNQDLWGWRPSLGSF